MYPDSYHFAGFDPASTVGTCCISCSRLDAKPVQVEPHPALMQTNEYDDGKSRRLHYVCKTCGATWSRLLRTGGRAGKAHYWQLNASGPAAR